MTCRTNLTASAMMLTLAVSAGAGAEESAAPVVSVKAKTDSSSMALSPAKAKMANIKGELKLGSDKAGGADEAKEAPLVPVDVPWRGSTVTWGHAVTTSAVGLGDDFQSTSHQAYTMSYGALLNYYLADQKDWSLQGRLGLGFNVEMTDGSTTTKHEPWFDDMLLGAAYGRKLWGLGDGGKHAGRMNFGTNLILPTSPSSSAASIYMRLSPSIGLSQGFGLLSGDHSWFKTGTLSLGLGWNHTFSKATTAVQDDLDRPRSSNTFGAEAFNEQSSGSLDGYSTQLSDQLTGSALTSDSLSQTLRFSTGGSFSGGSISVSTAVGLSQSFKHAFEGSECEVELLTGCVDAESESDPQTVLYSTTFSVGLGYQPLRELGISLGYSSASNQLGPDGQYRNPFYNPYAVFTAAITLHPDALYERLTAPERAARRDADRKVAGLPAGN